MTVRPRILLPFSVGDLDSRSLAAAAQLAALHLSQDPVLYADWNVTFDLTYLELSDTKEDGVHFPPTHPCVGAGAHQERLVIWYAAYRVGARLLREWDSGIDALIGGYSIAHLELQQLLIFQQDSESQVSLYKTWLPANASTQRTCRHQVATIGIGNDQRFENYRSRFPRYTSIQGNVVQTLQVGGGCHWRLGCYFSRAPHRKMQVLPTLFQLWGWKVGAMFGPKISSLLPIIDMNFKMSRIFLTKYDALHQL